MPTKTQLTEQHNAPEVPVLAEPQYVAPRQKTLERQGRSTAPMVHHMPQIRGGLCEWCGVIDQNVPSHQQYSLCPHFRGLGEMRCSYCDEAKDPTDVITHAVLNIMEHPTNRDQLVVVCNSYECSKKHLARFTTAS